MTISCDNLFYGACNVNTGQNARVVFILDWHLNLTVVTTNLISIHCALHTFRVTVNSNLHKRAVLSFSKDQYGSQFPKSLTQKSNCFISKRCEFPCWQYCSCFEWEPGPIISFTCKENITKFDVIVKLILVERMKNPVLLLSNISLVGH